MGFYAFLVLSRIKSLKLSLFCTKLGTQHHLVYIIVLKWLAWKIKVICQKLFAKLRFYGLLSFCGSFGDNQLKLGLFCTKLGTQHHLVYIIVLKCIALKINVVCYKLRAKLRFYVFLSCLGIFRHKVTWFVLLKTWHTTPFGIYYCVEVVRIENYSHMLEITCYAAILRAFKLFGHFRA